MPVQHIDAFMRGDHVRITADLKHERSGRELFNREGAYTMLVANGSRPVVEITLFQSGDDDLAVDEAGLMTLYVDQIELA